jgi:hypothetical protein
VKERDGTPETGHIRSAWARERSRERWQNLPPYRYVRGVAGALRVAEAPEQDAPGCLHSIEESGRALGARSLQQQKPSESRDGGLSARRSAASARRSAPATRPQFRRGDRSGPWDGTAARAPGLRKSPHPGPLPADWERVKERDGTPETGTHSQRVGTGALALLLGAGGLRSLGGLVTPDGNCLATVGQLVPAGRDTFC